MNLSTHFKTALTNLISTKMRSFLAALGILVGTASVVAMVSGGELATYQALQQFKALGTDLLAVSLNTKSTKQAGGSSSRAKLSLQTAFNVKNANPQIKTAAPYTTLYENVTFKGNKINASIVGATEDLAQTVKLKMLSGRFVSYVDKYSPYCVLGSKAYNQIKKYTPNPIGKQIHLGTHIFTIVGVLKPWQENSFVYANLNEVVFIPIQSSVLINAYSDIYNIVMKLQKKSDLNAVERDLKTYFSQHASNKQLFFRSAAQILKSMNKQRKILTAFLGFIGGIALLVGGIGIMNIMLVSVAERHREIGIRLAVGAKRRDIQIMFLIEAIILSGFGGIVGVISGETISFIISAFESWKFTFFILPPIIGFSVSVTAGIFFGFYPAYKASKLDPIETLRTE